MCLCTLCTERFLRSVDDSEVFRTYCRTRQIPFTPSAPASLPVGDVQRWIAAISGLRDDLQERVVWEQDAVCELSSRAGVAHLLDAANGSALPPDSIPDRGPLALWFLLHHTDLFRKVFFHHEHRELDVWHTAKAAPGLRVSDPDGVAAPLAEALAATFRSHDGTGRVCTVDAHRLPDALCFVARAAGRPRIVEEFSLGEPTLRQPLTSTLCVHFAYYPQDGTVLLQAPLQSADRVRALLACFGRHVLGFSIEDSCGGFALDRLKVPFHPPPDAADMELVRVKTLHLRYPERAGRLQLNLQTLTSDDPGAMDELLRAHVSDDMLTDLRVAHAELHVRLRVDGWSKNHLVRLWPDRCDVGRGTVGDRLLTCLRRWGLLT